MQNIFSFSPFRSEIEHCKCNKCEEFSLKGDYSCASIARRNLFWWLHSARLTAVASIVSRAAAGKAMRFKCNEPFMCKVYIVVDVYIQLPSEADDWWLPLIYNAQPNVHNYERHDHRRRLKAFKWLSKQIHFDVQVNFSIPLLCA